MTQHEQSSGSGVLTLFLTFLGGALLGGVAAALFTPRSGAEMRRRIAGVAGETQEVASRVPKAMREASSAAQDAFVAALK
ncbi:MAG: YtxH domain-containing protein [Deltaproteobacteria bacterium]|nr:YtxH domain-containing protein [Deltaproteobacteria bacterium]